MKPKHDIVKMTDISEAIRAFRRPVETNYSKSIPSVLYDPRGSLSIRRVLNAAREKLMECECQDQDNLMITILDLEYIISKIDG